MASQRAPSATLEMANAAAPAAICAANDHGGHPTTRLIVEELGDSGACVYKAIDIATGATVLEIPRARIGDHEEPGADLFGAALSAKT